MDAFVHVDVAEEVAYLAAASV